MLKRVAVLFTILWVLFLIPAFAERVSKASVSMPLTLQDCYKLALKRSETIAIAAEVIKEAEAHFLQALSIIMPHISYSSMDLKQDIPSSDTAYARNQYERKFVYKQTLFSGFKAFAGITGSKLEKKQRTKEKIRAEQLLFADVSDAFYTLIEQKEDLKTLGIIKDALLNRISELKTREELGKSRHSEVVNTQVLFYTVESQLEQVKSIEAVARDILEFLTGISISDIIDSYSGFPNLGNEDFYNVKVLMRPDIQAAEFAWDIAKKRTMIAKSGFLPTVSLEGNSYTARNTPPSDSKWDVMLSIDLPIFDGAQTLGDVKEANAKTLEAELVFTRLKRSAATDIRDAYSRLKNSIAMTKSLSKALSASYTNYNLQREDYRLNLVNNLDVLDAIRTMGESRRDFIHLLYATKRLYWQLLVATGEAI